MSARRWQITETSSAVIEAESIEEAKRLYREYPLNPERQAAVKRIVPAELTVTEVQS